MGEYMQEVFVDKISYILCAMKFHVSETEIQSAVFQLLCLKGYYVWRSQPMRVPGRKVPEYLRGMPDLMALKGGMFLGVELKSEKGTQSDDQKRWQESIEKHGGRYILAKCVEEVESIV